MPPTSDFDNESFDAFERILNKLDSEDKELIIIGDTNCDLMSKADRNTNRIKSLYDLFHLNSKSEITPVLLLKRMEMARN